MPRRSVTRRTALTGLSASATVLLLAGCDIRLEQGAHPLPGLQTQGPPADTAALQATAAGRRTLLATLRQPARGWPTRLKPVYAAQLTRTQAVMASAGMPQAGSTPGAPATSVASFPVALRGQLGPATFGRIAGVEAVYTPMLAAVSAVDAAAVVVLGSHQVSWPAAGLPATVAGALAPGLREAVYGLEVVAARTPLKQRALVASCLDALYPARSQLELAAGSSAPPAQSSYRLPGDPGTAAGRTRLAQQLLGNVVTACAGQAAATRGAADDVARLLDLWGTALGLAWRWGVSPVPFPGLTG